MIRDSRAPVFGAAGRLEEICGLSQGYLTHLINGDNRRPREEVLRAIAHTLGQKYEEYRVALLADHHELPSPEYYFRGLGIPIDEKTADTVMQFVKDLTKDLIDEGPERKD